MDPPQRPVRLNSLLYKYERDLAWMAEQLGDTRTQSTGTSRQPRRAAINKYLWNPEKGMYYDYDFMAGKQSTYDYLTTFYPLWAGAADAQQAKAVEANLKFFERAGGTAMSPYETGVQWDLPYGWAPVTWLTVDGLAKTGDMKDAVRISQKFREMVKQNYECDRSIREKYDVITASTEVNVASGYKTNVIGFGWTNSAYLKMGALIKVLPSAPNRSRSRTACARRPRPLHKDNGPSAILPAPAKFIAPTGYLARHPAHGRVCARAEEVLPHLSRSDQKSVETMVLGVPQSNPLRLAQLKRAFEDVECTGANLHEQSTSARLKPAV